MPITRPAPRIHLRPIRLDDVDAIMTWINDPEVVKNFAAMGHVTREQELAFLQRITTSDTDRLYAIETLDGRYLGNAGIHKIWWPARNGRLGIVIGDRASQGKGLGLEAMELLLEKGFEELGLHKLWLVHYATNERMRHLAGKLGMKEEGVLRDEYFHDGRFHDMVRHAILEDEHRSRTARGGLQPSDRG